MTHRLDNDRAEDLVIESDNAYVVVTRGREGGKVSDQDRPTPRRGENDPPTRPSGRAASRRPNRAQVKAMEARMAARPIAERIPVVVVDSTTVPTANPEVAPEAVGVPTGRARSRARTRTAPRPTGLTRAEEYRFIRSDLRRLLLTAGGLGVVMLALLLVLEI